VHLAADAFAAGRGALARAFPVEAAVARGVREWLAQRGQCNPHAPRANGEGGSDHRVMVVAGIESSLDRAGSSLPLPLASLGYRSDEVTYFSYADQRGYGVHDTEGPILAAAYRLAEQLRALQRREPGREVDLIAHSQGGVVVEAFLTQIYDRGDPSYPPLGTVVTLSSPLRGAPLAHTAAAVGRTRAGDAALRRLLPVARTPAVRDLASDSALMQQLDDAPLPELIELTTIGGATDLIVPGTAATRPGARRATLIPHALNAHTGMLTDARTLATVRAALEDRPLPCRGLLTSVAGEVLPTVVTGAELGAGNALAALSAPGGPTP
jgi:triacylglycerol esterase/lipase EstA (alpha/beta hydrolase family)